ncbi:sulfatase-like hydrolase/transferase [Devosia sp. SL43]|uniref:sulfatase-like hydrolase/transferase n=1 Tax=Devosia sp. SL43 TaxID=2806348 RepID=UPI001F359AE1|nr:sulfatase-like hydrolase/transferase [Devosia sp. SL43]UJW85094.1 sulfatase-like hydrolase/transferase [Devosia sp. SL43]
MARVGSTTTQSVALSILQLALVSAIGPLLIWYVNINRIGPDVVVLGIAMLFGALLVLQLLAIAIFRRPALSGLVLVLATIGLLYDGLVGTQLIAGGVWIWAAVFAGLIIVCLRSGKVAAEAGKFTTIFLTMLCVLLLGSIATNGVWQERGAIRAALAANYPPLAQPSVAPAATPDIYFVIFDRYARADMMARHYGHDNSAFLTALRERGFVVADDAFAAYQRTAHSVASTLNLGFVDTDGVGLGSNDWIPLYETLSSPRLFNFMQALGYQVDTLGSWWEPTRNSSLADSSDSYFAVPESLRSFSENALLARLLESTGSPFFDARQRQCERIRHQFDALSQAKTTDAPRFVFAHMLVPHPPFVIDAQGKCTSVAEASARTRAENYIGQLCLANSSTLSMVDTILARDRDAIIILQSDEGPWPAQYAGEEIQNFGADISSVEWRDVPPEELREKMATLSAIRMPGVDPEIIESDFTPVNTFRILLSEVFGVEMPKLERQAYVFHNDGALYDFSPVLPALESESEAVAQPSTLTSCISG